MITKDQLHRWQAVSEAATPGPWLPNVWIETDGNEWRATGPGHDSDDCEDSSPGCDDEQAAQRDAAFIAEARTAVPALLAEIERLRRLADDMCTNLALRGYPNLAAHFRKDLSHE